MTNTPTSLNDLVDDAIFLSAETQLLVQNRWGGLSWSVDTHTPSFVFEGTPPTVFRPHILGFSTVTPQRWAWGWDSSDFSEDTISLVKSLREKILSLDIPELSTQDESEWDSLPLRITIAIKALTGHAIHVAAKIGDNNTHVWMLLEDPKFALPDPTAATIAQAIREGSTGSYVTDIQRALTAYATQRRLPLRWDTPSPLITVATLTISESAAVRVEINEHGRVSRVSDLPTTQNSAAKSGEAAAPQQLSNAQHTPDPQDDTPQQRADAPQRTPDPQDRQQRGFFGRLFGGR
ncbi:DUF6882 domain-containing protein [Lysinibacter sp. HNR]|uniref:DUF6882 domain-containing protein n=1 Tax=Lysinibacter sp. HNR TaxID=3031408 RepID=UPI00243604C2|nr:DUF6882 domain-containing protein [Lysinibacter sp. HNR]WGD36389.1 hypothetical protein FrondiHNR_07830 [Lysinibacter sp. HNR]